MVIIWLTTICFIFMLRGLCNGREIFVSPVGRNNLNCSTMDNPCLTIQYAMENVAVSQDIIKIDGSHRKFTMQREVLILKCMNLTFTSYNGVAWIYRDVDTSIAATYGAFLAVDVTRTVGKCELIVKNTIFRDTVLFRSQNHYFSENQMTVNLIVRNCSFEFSKPMSTHYSIWLSPRLILMKSQYSIITMENCTIKANYEVGILVYEVGSSCKQFTSTDITLSNTRIEDAIDTVRAMMGSCKYTMLKKSFQLTIVNSVLTSTGKFHSGGAQISIFNAGRFERGVWSAVYVENSRFEKLSALDEAAAAIDIRGASQVFITNCLFKGNNGNRGGALSLRSRAIKIAHSQFYDNKARVLTICAQKDQGGTGGAILVDGSRETLLIELHNTTFINNAATCFGSAIYLGYSKAIVVKETEFNTNFTRSSDTMWFSYSKNLQIEQVSFQAGDESTLHGGLFFARSRTFTFGEGAPYFKCPLFSTINISKSTIGNYGNDRITQVKCHYCTKGTYTLTPSNMSGINRDQKRKKRLQSQCQSCRFGAECHRSIKPKPNFWGYVHKSKAFMILCPPGYCCQTPHQCMHLNSCNMKRTGQLCGKCKHGYFQSAFTNECFEEKVCKAANFWTVAIIMCLLFTALFILLQDIVLFLVKILRINNSLRVLNRRIGWLKAELSLKVKSSAIERRDLDPNRTESNDDREDEEVIAAGETDIDEAACNIERRGLDPMNNEPNEEGEDEEVERKPKSNKNSTAAGLIKIVFFFYQIHSILTVYKSNREIQYLREVKGLILSLFNLNAQIPIRSEFHCPFHGIQSTTKVWIKALFPVTCLMFTGFFYAFVYSISLFFSSSDCIKKHSSTVMSRLLTAIMQFILLGYSTLTSSILSLLTCLSLVNGERILYIDGNVLCYQTWQYAILTFILLWAIPLIYALHKLPRYMRNGEINIKGVYAALLLPLPFAVYAMVKGIRQMSCCKGNNTSNDQYKAPFMDYSPRENTNMIMSELLNVIEGPFRGTTSGKTGEKLSWEPILLLQRLLLSLCHTFVLEPGMRSLLLLLVMTIFLYMNALQRPFSSGFLNMANGGIFILLCITGIINTIYAFIYEYGSVPKGPLIQLLIVFDYIEVILVLIVPVIAIATLALLAVVKFTLFLGAIVGCIIAKCKRSKFNDE